MTKAEIVAALNLLAKLDWNVNMRGVNQKQDDSLVWIAKAIRGSTVIDASGDTFETCAEQLIQKIAP